MDAKLEVALIAFSGVVVSAAISLYSEHKTAQLANDNSRAIENLKIKDRDSRDEMKFVAPLARAAYTTFCIRDYLRFITREAPTEKSIISSPTRPI